MQNILIVSLSVCFACSVVVSSTAVMLKPQRIANKEADRYKNILVAAGLLKEGQTQGANVEELFEKFAIRLVDLEEGRFLSEEEAAAIGIDPATYDQRKASKDPDFSRKLDKSEDIASISRRARYSTVYLLENDAGDVERIVLPVHGYGLWSIMYGFLALEGDMSTVAGITFYEQQETAGLGGEVDNPAWKATWEGKELYEDGEIALRVLKGKIDPNSSNVEHQIDGLSGATLTSRGVDNLVHYWLGDEAFGPVLKTLEGAG
jgi:Na+-transporting NADH:ubiquinone oxidoreductase subunit C